MLSGAGTTIPVSDISIYPLLTGAQRDRISCGLFGLNSISHHYLPQTFSILQHNMSQTQVTPDMITHICQEKLTPNISDEEYYSWSPSRGEGGISPFSMEILSLSGGKNPQE